MQNTVNVLYYSIHSKSSDALFNMIRESNININNLMYIKLINIDCSLIKMKLLKSDKVNKVPCLISVDAENNVKHYEGKELFDLFRVIIATEQNKIIQSENETAKSNQLEAISAEFEKCANQSSEMIKTINDYETYITNVDDKNKRLTDELDNLKLEMEKIKEQQYEREVNFKNKVKFSSQPSTAENETTLDTDELVELGPTGGSIRTDSSNYENDVDFGKVQDINRDVSHKLEPKNIMAAAEAMQKDRE